SEVYHYSRREKVLLLICRTYIDDFVYTSDILEDHERYLYSLFSYLEEHNIKLELSKAYISFPEVTLLG
ncbi:hypothetical protein N7457_009379, partial [Penicillium paradoxum]|uniref:uncharacterized protein n=1 Tax=Penicillium paradoxum TaxID=176176 RepID=UPI0025474A62